MISLWIIFLATAAYMIGLFVVAWRRDMAAGRTGFQQSPIVYALALAVYCTSWTYYGAVGTAAASGWDFLPIYLGPALVFLCLPGLIARIADVAQRESITSLSDFLSARYGKSRAVAALATLAAVAGGVPYVALQLKSVGASFQALASGQDGAVAEPPNETVFVVALVLGLFAILFGARQTDTTKHFAGLMLVLAIEAVIKLAALIAVAALSVWLLSTRGVLETQSAAAVFTETGPSGRFITITLLAMGAMICLPRQFHIAIIERRSEGDVGRARWLFPAYMAATSLVVLPITLAGLQALPPSAAPDLYVLSLPLSEGRELLALFVFLGGFSAATGMVIVSTIALSTMVTNDLLLPAVMRTGRFDRLAGAAGIRLLSLRRTVIMAILVLAYGYYRLAGETEALAQIGLLAFAAAIQFAPALIGAVYWKGGRRDGVIAGLSAGMAVWAYTLALPAIVGPETMRTAVPTALAPQGLFGFDFGDGLTHGVIWSLGVNGFLFILVSTRARERLRDRIQAAAFVGDSAGRIAEPRPDTVPAAGVTPDGLKTLAARFLSTEAVDHAFAAFEADMRVAAAGDAPADWRLVQRTERLLASAIGASSARVVMSSAIGGANVALGDLLSILDHKTQAERFDRHMLQSMLENIAQGVSVVDQDQRLVAWNSAYVDLFDYPKDLVRLGEPVSRLIEYNIRKGWIDGDPAEEARRRIAHMKAGRSHRYERRNPDGRYLRITGHPMPGGGYVTTFTDITEDKRREAALVEANERLEERVADRTQELQDMAVDLDRARADAEGANASKTRFLAAASHDLLQPLNAARLFLGALRDRRPDDAELVEKADRAVRSADDLLKGLLDISRLDHSDVAAHPVVFPLAPLLEDLADEAAPMAAEAGLSLRVAPTRLTVRADPDFLQSILRNFLSNARRYTRSGGVLIGARRRSGRVRIEVWDTGPGVPEAKQAALFEEFQRFDDVDNLGVRGAGLGLSVARRMANLMGARIGLRSSLGRGSVFYVEVDRADTRAGGAQHRRAPKSPADRSDALAGLRVLCVDDEATIRDGMRALLTGWGCHVAAASGDADARQISAGQTFDAAIVDLQLGDGESGLALIDALCEQFAAAGAIALLTANASHWVEQAVKDRRVRLLHKPVEPEAVRAFLLSVRAAAQTYAAE